MATIRFFAAAKAATGVASMEVTANQVGQALDQAKTTFPQLTEVLNKCSYLLNEVSCQDLTAKLGDGDTLDVLPPFAGG